MTHEDKINDITNKLKKRINVLDSVDIGSGAELYMDATREEFDEAVDRLIKEDYSFAIIPIEKVGGGYINLELLGKPGKNWKRFREGLKKPSTFKERIVIAAEKREDRVDKVNKIKELTAKGLNNKDIAEELGMAESTVRNLRKFFKSING